MKKLFSPADFLLFMGFKKKGGNRFRNAQNIWYILKPRTNYYIWKGDCIKYGDFSESDFDAYEFDAIWSKDVL